MALSSGYSIQRTEIIDIPHRQNVETHTAIGSNTIYVLRSKPDFQDKTWVWEIKIGEIRIALNRNTGNNLLADSTQSPLIEFNNWQANTYTEGSLDAGLGVVRYITNIGEHGALEFLPQTAPVSGEKVTIGYQESEDNWTGTDGGLLYQLAKDLTVHPFETPEVFRNIPEKANYVLKTDHSAFVPAANILPAEIDQYTTVYGLDNKFGVEQDYAFTDQLESARIGSKIFRSVKEFSFTFKNHSFTPATGVDETDLYIGNFPLTLNDLGDGEFRIAVDGKVIPDSAWSVSSDRVNRTSRFRIFLESAKTWGWVLDRSDVDVEISYIWKHSLDVPYGAMIGKLGYGPIQEALDSEDYDLTNALKSEATTLDDVAVSVIRHQPPKSDPTTNPFGTTDNTGYIEIDVSSTDLNDPNHYQINTYYSETLRDRREVIKFGFVQGDVSSNVTGSAITINHNDQFVILDPDGVVVSGNVNTGTGTNVPGYWPTATLQLDVAATVTGDYTLQFTSSESHTALLELTKVKNSDAFMLFYEENEKFQPGFNLIYPKPVSNTPTAVKAALRDITDSFLVESAKGVDLLSDDNLIPEYYQVQSQRRPQKWRIRFEWDRKLQSIKVNVATEYQLLDDMSVSSGQTRDGIKSPIYREPGELCDVYLEPNTGRTIGYEMVKAKSHWFRRSGKTEDNISRTYPMSYRITVTDHGMGLFLWDQASVDQDDDYSWFVVQRHVDQTTGQPEFTQKSPVHCVYSPAKRPVDISDLNQYYSSSDVNDLTKSPNIYTSLGQMLETEGPTMYISATGATPVFNGYTNALDFTGYGYTAGLLSATNVQNLNQGVKQELDRGIIGGATTNTTDYWSLATWETAPGSSSVDALRSKQNVALLTQLVPVNGNPEVIGDFGGQHDPAFPDPSSFPLWDFWTDNYDLGDREIVVTYKDIPNAGNTLTLVAGEDYIIDRQAKFITFFGGTGSLNPISQRINQSQPIDPSTTTITVKIASGQLVENRSKVNDLQIVGFETLPRDGQQVTPPGGSAQNNSNAVADGSIWLVDATLAPHYSGNVVFPTNRIERVSSFQAAAANNTAINDSVTGASLGEWSDPSYALLDILYNENVQNMEKVMESMVVAVDGEELERDTKGYILQYDEWVRSGDPQACGRFIQSLDAAGVNELGRYFRLPAFTETVTELRTVDGAPDTPVEVEHLIIPQEIVNIILGLENRIDFDPSTGSGATQTYRNDTTNDTYSVHLSVELYDRFFKYIDPQNTYRQQSTNQVLGWLAVKYYGNEGTILEADSADHDARNHLIKSTITATSVLTGKLPGDPVFSSGDDRQRYIYDFFNQTLFFRTAPRHSSELIIKLINYVYSDPARNSYYITSPADRDFPERNQNKEKTINRFVVREQDVLKPWDYHVSATMHEVDSHAVINPQEQLSITQDRDFVFSFPTQLTSQRFYYPRSELDLICISSADFSTQSGSIEIDKYQDSNGLSGNVLNIDGIDIDPSPNDAGDDFEWGGHVGPTGDTYFWKRNKRKYEGMMSTMPNGNGMRVFLQVSGSSIKWTDVVEGASPA